MSRFYVHTASNTISSSQHSFVFSSDDSNATVNDLIAAFLDDFHRVHPNLIATLAKNQSDDQFAVTNAQGETFSLNDFLETSFDDRDDVFISIDTQPINQTNNQSNHSTTNKSIDATKRKEPEKESTSKSNQSINPTINQSTNSTQISPTLLNPSELKAVNEFEAAKKLQKNGKFAQASNKFINVIDTLTDSQSMNEREDLRSIRRQSNLFVALIHFQNHRYEKAQSFFVQAIKLSDSFTYRLKTNDQSSSNPNNQSSIIEQVELLHYSSLCHFYLKEIDEAELSIARSLTIIAQLANSSTANSTITSLIWSLKVTQARIRYASNVPIKRQEAVVACESIIAENDYFTPCLIAYAAIAVDRGMTLDVIPYLLRAIVNLSQSHQSKPPTNKPTNQSQIPPVQPTINTGATSIAITSDLRVQCYDLFVQLVSLNGGVEALLIALGPAASIPASISFLAQTLKEHSGIAPAIALYHRALRLTPKVSIREVAHLTLSLIHTLEIAYEYQRAFDIIRSFIASNVTMKIGDVGLDSLHEILQEIPRIDDRSMMLGESSSIPPFHALKPLFDAGVSQVLIPGSPSFTVNKHGKLTSGGLLQPYEPEQLDCLAMAFTVVKILYLQGSIQPLSSLIERLEPLRKDKQLHLTVIRNEHAYYSTVAQCIQSSLMPPINAALDDCSSLIHCIGDSHCLSSAWQPITVNDRPRSFRPWLVTGMKCWHMRADCKFYTKANFNAAICQLEQVLNQHKQKQQTIDQPSIVLFVFGEIDCREGLLNAMEAAKYDSLNAAISLCVDVYVQYVVSFAQRNECIAFIHPIIPVLDPTRAMVVQFNQALMEKVDSLQSTRVKFLHFFDDLLKADGSFQGDKFGLDGTHLHPTYCKLIQQEINRALTI